MTYEYKCPECGLRFEKTQSMKEVHEASCPKCGLKARLIISGGTGFIFKVLGFPSNESRKLNDPIIKKQKEMYDKQYTVDEL